MIGAEVRLARKRKRWSQKELARALGVTQAYVCQLESGTRAVPHGLTVKLAALLAGSAAWLPARRLGASKVGDSRESLSDDLAGLGHPLFLHRRKGAAMRGPSEVLIRTVDSLAHADAAIVAALPWILLSFDEIEVDYLVREAKLNDLQNRLGFLVAVARTIAEREAEFQSRARPLALLEQRLERSRLAAEDTFGGPAVSEPMRAWLREHRSDLARHWNLLTDLQVGDFPYSGGIPSHGVESDDI